MWLPATLGEGGPAAPSLGVVYDAKSFTSEELVARHEPTADVHLCVN